MITPDMINDKLVRVIATSSSHIPGSWTQTYEIVRHTLASLASNPIEPPVDDPDLDSLRGEKEKRNGIYFTARGAAIEWQRHAYLKKEEPIPQGLKDIYAEHGFCSADVMDALQKAYNLGKGESK